MAIGVMALALFVSLLVIGGGSLLPATYGGPLETQLRSILVSLQAEDLLLHGILGFLLFAASLHVDLNDLVSHRGSIALLATLGVALSMATAAACLWMASQMMGAELSFIHCLLFGALIAPTDPIAVMSILKKVGAPKSLETVIGGESLFNDGVGVVAFVIMLQIAGFGGGHGEVTTGAVVALLLKEAVGGIALGLALGYAVYRLMRGVDHYTVEVLLSVALVAGGYVLAEALHVSAPLAMVAAGLLLGNHGRTLAMSPKTEEHLDSFWEMIDELLNAMLFLVLGLEILILPSSPGIWLLGVVMIPLALLSRAFAVSIPLGVLKLLPTGRSAPLPKGSLSVLTWGGLKGGISVALALSIPAASTQALPVRDILIVVTYVVVAFSILVQGLTMAPLLRRLGLSIQSP